MQEEGIQARVRKRYRCTTMSDHDQPIAANVLGREFAAAAPNQRWVGDTTEMLTTSGGKSTSRRSSTSSPDTASAGP